jgi:hypothetical protein
VVVLGVVSIEIFVTGTIALKAAFEEFDKS